MAEKLDPETIGEPAADAEAGLTAILRFRSLQPGNEPIGKSFEIGIWQDGLRDEAGIGAAGDRASPIGAQAAAKLLLERFDRAELERLLSHIAELHSAIS